ncbi:MAG: hypothetical protein P8M30_15105 [Planctomycetaceae bacterium]|jgi:hypothetical protein|nr:hypothetical protein [Planctomycetaceae bacterium]MDG2390635.1 hypothetical protein [Planctomycetaceae bacterium]
MTNPCEKCGSEKIIPDVRVVDQGHLSDGNLKAVVHGESVGFFFKERVYGQLIADICGECGHAELKVVNPQHLCRKYQESLENS